MCTARTGVRFEQACVVGIRERRGPVIDSTTLERLVGAHSDARGEEVCQEAEHALDTDNELARTIEANELSFRGMAISKTICVHKAVVLRKFTPNIAGNHW